MAAMKHLPPTARRVIAVAAAAVAGLAISTTAYAATSSSTASTTAAAIPKCTASDLGVWVAVDQGNGAAGTIYYPLEFTNLSGHACSLFGYPGVSAIGRSGSQLGSPAEWGSRAGARTVYLAPGATAHTILAYHDAAVSTQPGCDPVYTATLLRVYPPDQYHATYAAFAFEVCSHAGPIYMNVTEPIIPGVGTIYG
jgi:Protein of unknown function (DUF4232)